MNTFTYKKINKIRIFPRHFAVCDHFARSSYSLFVSIISCCEASIEVDLFMMYILFFNDIIIICTFFILKEQELHIDETYYDNNNNGNKEHEKKHTHNMTTNREIFHISPL